ncbi:MAG: serine/threonine protein kinase, partial [Anaerolineae bacterium]
MQYNYAVEPLNSLSLQRTRPLIGTILSNRYRILRELGAGGMAKVYLAEDINQSQMVAVKILHSQFGEDLSYVQRFKREAKLASLLTSPHIVNIIDYGSSRDTHFLVMEYVEGQDLREILDRRGPFPWKEAFGLIDQICQALENANEYNVVHRDIKPQNIMITEQGQLKVLDFGIARARMLPSLTQSGFVGSPYYISPEQAMGEEVDIRSDIYSTGIVLYELLTGQVPFDSKSPWSIISKHIASEFPDINLSDPSIPPAVRPFIEQMVAKRPEDRFQTPTMVRRAITALVTGKELPPLPVTPTSAKIDKEAMARSLFHRAEEAMQEKEWQKAVSLLNQTITLDPHHPHAAEALAEAGSQARIAALYKAAGQAMESNRWQEAIDELTEILETTPDYKNSAALMTQARAALEKETSELQLPQLYEQALAAFEAGDYPRAQELFAQVKDISPTYRRADALWAASKRRNTRSGSFKRLSQKITPRQQKSGFPLAWMAATAVIVLGIVAAVLIVGRNNAPPPTPTPALSNLYTRAEQALNENNLTQAASLLGQIAALAPNDPALAPLQKQLARQQT